MVQAGAPMHTGLTALLCLSVISWLSAGAVAGQTRVRDSEEAARHLNAQFLGHGTGAVSGVVVRNLFKWELWCGEDCYKGRPDCVLSAMVFNSHVGMWHGMFKGEFPFASSNAGVLFDMDAVQNRFARCYYYTDALSWYRYNGGCGCKAEVADMSCSSPNCPYRNFLNGQFVDGDSPYATRCLCRSTDQRDACFWRGPAYNRSKGPFGGSELSKMMEQYIRSGKSELRMQWNELVLDAGLIKRALATDPGSVIVAIFYYIDMEYPAEIPDNLATALRVGRNLTAEYGVEFPVVGINRSSIVTLDNGPFVPHKQMVGSDSGSLPVVV